MRTPDAPDIRPALSPLQWAAREYSNLRVPSLNVFTVALDDDDAAEEECLFIGCTQRGANDDGSGQFGFGGEHPVFADERHGLAALCLYGQTFGFTQEDVDALNTWGLVTDWFGTEAELKAELAKRDATIRSLASRIAALLPPLPPAP